MGAGAGASQGVAGAVTAGTVIGMGSQLPELPISGRELIAICLHLRPGNSGGPLVDVQGRLVGINTMMAGPEVGLAVKLAVGCWFAGGEGVSESSLE